MAYLAGRMPDLGVGCGSAEVVLGTPACLLACGAAIALRVEIEIEDTLVAEGRGAGSPGLSATCSRCDHCVETVGEGPAAEAILQQRLRRTCPLREQNRYFVPREDMED